MKKLIWIAVLFCIGCSRTEKAPAIHISLIDNNQSVKVTGLDKAVINDIARDSSNEVWEGLIAVHRLPTDTDMKDYQLVQPGKYLLKDSSVVFTPDTPFAKNRSYFLRFYQFNKGSTVADFIKGRRQPGNNRYIDFQFKY
jgi:hypothetical protein